MFDELFFDSLLLRRVASDVLELVKPRTGDRLYQQTPLVNDFREDEVLL